ncbi:MAG TPA: hypothetical protein VJ732_15025 [Bryobacteraceae bacterium]|nr:hypothetical protein [Bryobacteraceae bacterium]
MGRVLAAILFLAGAAPWLPAQSDPSPPGIRELKDVERSAGFKPTGNFERLDPGITAYYRCYYTGKLKLPQSYDELDLREGTKDGCALEANKYDIFFYPIEAVASGHAPVTDGLAKDTPERVATVVSHEDFHEQVKDLPDRIAEAAATLAGFLTGEAALGSGHAGPDEAALFLVKSDLVNRYFDRLSTIYRRERRNQMTEAAALAQKQQLLNSLERECRAIHPDPRSFNKCVSAPNNAGLAFDHTYTMYYPLLYRVYLGCGKDLKCTVGRILAAPRKRGEKETAAYFRTIAAE